MNYENSLYRNLARYPSIFGYASIEDVMGLADKDKPGLIQSRERFPDVSDTDDYVIL